MIYQWLPTSYNIGVSLGGWCLERTEQLFYLDRPVNEWRTEVSLFEFEEEVTK